MNQNRKQDMPNRPSSTDSEGRRRERSVMDDEETFEHGSGGSEVSRGMGSDERGSGGKDKGQGKRQPTERGRSDSER